MQIQTIETYSYDELSEEAKKQVLESLSDINIDYDWWEYVYEDAENSGLKITGFDIGRGSYVEGELNTYIEASINAILTNHGEKTPTFKLAQLYSEEIKKLDKQFKNREEDEDEGEAHVNETFELNRRYQEELCEEYLSMLKKEYEYRTSIEAIEETIQANDYSFTKDGSRSVYL